MIAHWIKDEIIYLTVFQVFIKQYALVRVSKKIETHANEFVHKFA